MNKLNSHIRYYKGVDSHNYAACVFRTPPQLLDNQSIRNYQLSIVGTEDLESGGLQSNQSIKNYELSILEDGSREMAVFHRGSRKFGNLWGRGAEKVINKHINRIVNKIFIVINNQIHSL